MKTILFAAAASAMALSAVPAAAASYGQVNLGVGVGGKVDAHVVDSTFGDVSGKLDLDTGYLVSGSWGMHANPNIRLEGEMAYTDNNISGGLNIHQIAILGNAIYDFKPEGKFSPYVGVGGGFGRTFIKIPEGTDNDTGFAWQLRAGVNIRQGEGKVWDIGYRYLRMAPYSKSDSGESVDLKGSVHALTVGLRFGG